MKTITLTNAFTGDPQYNPCTQIAVGTSLDLKRTISGTPPNTSSLSFWFKRETDAIIELGTANDCLRIAADGTLALVANGTSSSNFQDAASSDTIATAGNWHHLAWIKNNDQHTLYLNGIACQTQTLAEAPNPATIDTITSAGAAAYIVHMHGYGRALEATEVVADKMGQHNATQSFTDQYPLNFTLKDRSIEGATEMPDDKLIIEDIAGKERTYQRLVITNVADETLKFVPNTNAVSKDNYHLELRFRNGTFVSPSEYPKFDNFETDNLLAGEPSGIPAGWQATDPLQHLQDGSWSVYLLRTAALEVASNDTLEFIFEYTTADGSLGGRSTRVALSYQQMEYADDGQAVAGIREKQIDIINNSSNNAHVSALNKKVTEADAKVDQLEEDARKEIDHLATLLNSHASGSKDRLSNPSVSSFSINVWQETNSYAPDDYVTKDGILYKATSAIASDAPWNVANWEDRSWDASSSYAKNDFVQKDAKIYRATQVINANIPWDEAQWEVYAPSKEVLKSIIGVLGTLADNIKAVDDEVDDRAAKQDEINDMLEKPFPLVASVSTPEGVVCGDSGTSLQFKLTNVGSKAVSFNSNSKFRFILPKGGTSSDLVDNDSDVGSGNNGLVKSSSGSSSNTVVFTWGPPSGSEIAPRTSEIFTISGITPNAEPGFVTIFIEYQGIVGYPSGKLSVAVSKVSKDIAQLVGGGNVGIGTNDPKSKLDVEGGVAIGANYSGTTAAPTNGLLVEGNVGIGTNDPKSKLDVEGGVAIGANYSGTTAAPTNGLLVEGNVGIGTDDPKEKLHINGTLRLEGVMGQFSVHTDNSSIANKKEYIQFVKTDGSTDGARLYAEGGSNKGKLVLGFGDDINADEAFIIRGEKNDGTIREIATFRGDGNVGIGTTSPNAKLEVDGNIKIKSGNKLILSDGVYGRGFFHASNSSPHLTIATSPDENIAIGHTDNINRIFIKGDGNVGIGTTNPEYKLDFGTESVSTIRMVQQNGGTAIRIGAGSGSSDVTLLRVDGNDEEYDGESNSANYGFSLKYMGARSSNANSLSVFSDNKQGTQVEALTIFQDGNVGIGTTNPQAKLDVYGHIRLSTPHNQYSILKCEGNAFKIFLKDGRSSYNDRTAAWDGDSNWDYSSDKKLKTNILDEKNILERLIQLNVKNYNWKDKPDQNPKPIGFIAQDVKPLFPYVASESVNEETKETSLTLKYNSFGVLAVGAIKELNDKFESALEKLTKKVDALAKKVK